MPLNSPSSLCGDSLGLDCWLFSRSYFSMSASFLALYLSFTLCSGRSLSPVVSQLVLYCYFHSVVISLLEGSKCLFGGVVPDVLTKHQSSVDIISLPSHLAPPLAFGLCLAHIPALHTESDSFLFFILLFFCLLYPTVMDAQQCL